MKLRVAIVDQQRAGRVGRAALRLAVPRLLAQAAPRRAHPWSSVTVVLLDDEGIRAMNRRVFGLDKVTDVITQALRPQPGAPSGWSGDLYLNVERALAEGAVRPGGPEPEQLLAPAAGEQAERTRSRQAVEDPADQVEIVAV